MEQVAKESPTLEILKNHLDAVLCSVLWDDSAFGEEVGPSDPL